MARRVSSLRRVAAFLCAAALGVACNAVFGIGDHELEPDGGEPAGDGASRADAPFDAKRPDATRPDGGGPPDREIPDAAADAEASSALPPPFASCTPDGPGRTNCGADRDAGCCSSPVVEGGTYHRTYEEGDAAPLPPTDLATISNVRVDTFEVTVGRFRQFVDAWLGGFRPPAGSGKHTHLNGGKGLAVAGVAGAFERGWLTSNDGLVTLTEKELDCLPGSATWTPSPAGHENLPMTCANRYEAYAFCIWDGGFLPSEAEWEYAAAGGAAQRRYPWGSTPPGTKSVYADFDCLYPKPVDSGMCLGVQNIEDVGMDPMGAGLWGQMDLAGNALEWVLDFYAPYVDPCTDCAAFSSDADAGIGVGRGGSFAFSESSILPVWREQENPTEGYEYLGIRCARAP